MAKKKVCGDEWISLWQDDSGTYTVWMEDGVTIVPMTADNKVMLISEPSVAYDGMRSLLLPGGGLEHDEDPTECANRELQEEIKLKAERIDLLGAIHTSIKYVHVKLHIVLARDLVPSELEGDEPAGWIEQHEPIALDQIETLVAEGRLINAPTITALFLARNFIQNEGKSAI